MGSLVQSVTEFEQIVQNIFQGQGYEAQTFPLKNDLLRIRSKSTLLPEVRSRYSHGIEVGKIEVKEGGLVYVCPDHAHFNEAFKEVSERIGSLGHRTSFEYCYD